MSFFYILDVFFLIFNKRWAIDVKRRWFKMFICQYCSRYMVVIYNISWTVLTDGRMIILQWTWLRCEVDLLLTSADVRRDYNRHTMTRRQHRCKRWHKTTSHRIAATVLSLNCKKCNILHTLCINPVKNLAQRWRTAKSLPVCSVCHLCHK